MRLTRLERLFWSLYRPDEYNSMISSYSHKMNYTREIVVSLTNQVPAYVVKP